MLKIPSAALRRSIGTKGVELVAKNFGLDRYWAEVERQIQSVAKDDRLDLTWAGVGETTVA